MSGRLIYQVAVGPRRTLWERCMPTVERYAERIGAEYLRQRTPILRIAPHNSHRSEGALRLGYLPIFEKANALALLDDHEQVAVIDADVWVRDDAPDVFEGRESDFAGVVERELPATEAYARKMRVYARGQYGDGDFEYVNMGVMVMRSSLREHCPEPPAEFLRRAEFADFVDGVGPYRWSTDQTLLNTWLASCGASTERLDWRWNALYGAVTPDALDEAHFVHFFLHEHLTSDDPEELMRTRTGRPRV